MSPLVALQFYLPQLVVASPLVTPPMTLDASAATSQLAIASPCASVMTSRLPLVKNTLPVPGMLSFEGRMPADEWTKMGAILGFWLVSAL